MEGETPDINFLNLLEEAYDSGNWFQFPKPFLDIMPHMEALLLSYLQSHSKRSKRHLKWFYCHASRICSDLRISSDQQTRLMKKLINRGFIKMKWEKNKIPSQRLLWICWDKIALKLHETFGERIHKVEIVEESEQDKRFRVWDEEADTWKNVSTKGSAAARGPGLRENA